MTVSHSVVHSLDKTKVRAAFDRAASGYDTLATFQHQIGERLAAWLAQQCIEIPAPDYVLDAGCGTGYGIELLRSDWPRATFIGCDAAPAMAMQANRRAANAVCSDIEQLPFRSAGFDACWSSMALQWCRLPQALSEFHRVLVPGGILAFSTLGPRTLHELDTAFSGIDNHRRFLSFPSTDIIESALTLAGFSRIRLLRENWVTYHPDLKRLLMTIRGIGAYQTGSNRRRALMGREAWRTIEARYETLRDSDGLLPASYDVIFGFAKNDCEI